MDVSAPAKAKPQTITKADPKLAKAMGQTKSQTTNNSITVAIFATIVIVLSLAILATFAYIKQKS